MFPGEHIGRYRAADHRRSVGRTARLEVHSPAPVTARGDRRREQPQTHMRQRGPRREPNTRLGAKHQSVVGDGTENVALARGKRFRRTHGRVEKPKSPRRQGDNARRLQFGAVQVTGPLQSWAGLFSPRLRYSHSVPSVIVQPNAQVLYMGGCVYPGVRDRCAGDLAAETGRRRGLLGQEDVDHRGHLFGFRIGGDGMGRRRHVAAPCAYLLQQRLDFSSGRVASLSDTPPFR